MGPMRSLGEMVGKFAKMPNLAALAKPKSGDKEKHAEWWGKDTARRKPREQLWQLCCSMVLGNQWCGWSGTSVQPLQAPSWRIQAVDNKLFVRVRSKQTRLLTDMNPVVIPESNDDFDIRKAKYKERLIAHARRETNDLRLRLRASQWLVVCGEVYTEVYWDESAGDTYADDGGAYSEGDVAVKIWDPFSVWPGAGSSAGNNGGRLWTVEMVPVELARLKFNDDKIAPDATDSSDVRLRANMDNFFSGSSTNVYGGGSERGGLEDLVLIKTLREYRTKALPTGRKSIIINGKVVDEQSLTWDGITHILNYPQFNSYHGDPVELRNSIQRQKSYNRLLSNWEEYVRTMAKGKILTHKSNNIKASQFDSENMEVVKYEGSGPPPTPWMPPPMPSDTSNLLALNTTAMDDLFSDHLSSQGKAPASASGAAVNYLQEQDDSQHTMSRDEWLVGWARTYEKELDVMAGRSGVGGYKEDRMIAVLGDDRRADVQKIEMEMLAGKNRVVIQCGGALPDNKTLRAEIVRRWFVDGLLGDPKLPETQKKAMKMTDAALVGDVYSDDVLDEIRAEEENRRMAVGERVAPRPEDNNVVHSRSHGHYMKSSAFLALPPEIQDVFYDHKDIHDEMAIQEAANPLLPGNVSVPRPQSPPAGATADSAPNAPGNSPAIANQDGTLKSVVQGSEAPPMPGAMPIAQGETQ